MMPGPCQIFLDAIAADMVLLEPIMARIAYNSQQYQNCISNNPPAPMTPSMQTESLMAASKEHAEHDMRTAIAKRMVKEIEKTGTKVRRCVAHCEAAIEILRGVE